ncbi:MAG TPA: amino acid adenylation domain-containing protein, partial [Phycisphaerae bacterium]|nr:amino acid adenylation domain-containing protein [Phycisphaerae bacterium]HRY69237.1 amino acid adenylation domain-containing protein [Phycisphaerae bacterium]HSA26555.1 amino acid adenylation domain-containing protein [Phycisphaerae bacterium]
MLTYAELNRQSNQLARHLRGLGVGPEVRVGICVERSLDMVVGLLGILKAGGAYVPLDPAYPQERLRFILEDTAAPVVVAQSSLAERLSSYRGQVVYLDRDAALIAARSCDPLAEERATASNLAYVIYTSGSTGRPKGVAIEHRSTVDLLHWARTVYSPGELIGVLASTSLCFDLSVFELFVPLSWGGTVILAENALAVPSLPEAPRVTLINTVPSAMAELLRLRAVPASVGTVNLAGEPLTAQLADSIYALGTVSKVYDLYGPSEDTTYSTVALRKPGGKATIGRPIANTSVYILDERGHPVAIGTPGELFITGNGLARGYLDRADLTAERFVPDPFAGKSGARMYRTGDLARFLPDGNIEFLGRIDHQVKIRGFRIELGEIEFQLREHESILQAVVVGHGAAGYDKQLVAYVVPKNGLPIDVAELRRHLKARLPEYMVPGFFVELTALPLSPNGKLDRKALPAPDASRPQTGRRYAPPRSPLEDLLASIWQQVLGLERVG